MSYWDIAQMSLDNDLTQREAAAAAQEQPDDPTTWALANGMRLAASPGWADAWASAVAAELPQPGRDPAVITDGMILSAVQGLVGGAAATAKKAKT